MRSVRGWTPARFAATEITYTGLPRVTLFFLYHDNGAVKVPVSVGADSRQGCAGGLRGRSADEGLADLLLDVRRSEGDEAVAGLHLLLGTSAHQALLAHDDADRRAFGKPQVADGLAGGRR